MGMLALTGIVFSLAFVMVRFSATAYSPPLVLWIARDPLLYHAIGAFTATFLCALAALAWVDRNRSGKVSFVTAWLVIALLLASVAMFVGLHPANGLLQIHRMLAFTGNHGRRAIETMYPPFETAGDEEGSKWVRFEIRAERLGLVIPQPKWEDFVALTFEKNCFCGATSVQVMRRMKAY
jgi:uncharacterized membrane protein